MVLKKRNSRRVDDTRRGLSGTEAAAMAWLRMTGPMAVVRKVWATKCGNHCLTRYALLAT